MSAEHSIPVGSGRILAYREYGDPAGAVVVNCHGGLLCGLDVAPFDATARALGLRILSPDRPGLGASSALPGRTTVDWAADVRSLIDGPAIFGWSMGGQYALACAAMLPERVTRTTVVAGCLPLDDEATFKSLNAMDRRLTRLSQHHPQVAAATFRTLGEIARDAPETWAHLTMRGAVPDEASAVEALPDPGIAAAAAVALGVATAWWRNTGPGPAPGDSRRATSAARSPSGTAIRTNSYRPPGPNNSRPRCPTRD